MFPQNISNTEPKERGAIAITEQWVTDKGLAGAFRQKFTKHFRGLRPQWANTFFASLSVQKARYPAHAAEVLSDAVGRVALFEEPGAEVLNDRAENRQ